MTMAIKLNKEEDEKRSFCYPCKLSDAFLGIQIVSVT